MCSLLSRENVFVKFSVSKRGKTNLSVVEEHTLKRVRATRSIRIPRKNQSPSLLTPAYRLHLILILLLFTSTTTIFGRLGIFLEHVHDRFGSPLTLLPRLLRDRSRRFQLEELLNDRASDHRAQRVESRASHLREIVPVHASVDEVFHHPRRIER